MVYTQTNWSAVSSPSDFLQVANTNTSGYGWTGIFFMVFMVLVASLSAYIVPEGALLAASFIGFLLSMLLAYLGLISFKIVGGMIALIVISVMYIIWSNRYD